MDAEAAAREGGLLAGWSQLSSGLRGGAVHQVLVNCRIRKETFVARDPKMLSLIEKRVAQ
jgi:hypothetical protein